MRRARGLIGCLLILGIAACNQITGNTEPVTTRCLDGEKDFGESDVDCGGPCGSTCDVGRTCNRDDDCSNGHCCDGHCVSVDGDPQNCGGCGHDCRGTSCTGSLCAVTSETSSSSSLPITLLAADASNLFWYDGDSIVQRDLDASNDDVTLVSGKPDIRSLVAKDVFVYYADGASLWRLTTDLPDQPPDQLTMDPVDTTTLAVNATNVFWRKCSNHQVVAASNAGPSTAHVLGLGQICPLEPPEGDIIADETSVYWVNDSSQSILLKHDLVAPPPGTTSTIAHADGASIVRPAVETGLVYYAVQYTSSYTIVRTALDGAPTSDDERTCDGGHAQGRDDELTCGSGIVEGLAVKDAKVYWTVQDGAACEVRTARAGERGYALARDESATCGAIVVSGDRVYWVRALNGNTEIASVAR